ncbi:MAG: lysophospholipase [Terriglobia bacterium]|nr:MAG: lysophospholipase [Terriglobia bacterium]
MVKHLLFACLLFEAIASAQQANDYSDPKAWICRPGGHDACDVDLSTTVIAPDGKLTRESWTADANAPVDCFYVYPTVSTDATPNSDMVADEAERNVIRQQFARFASKCRPYAPMYRQVTLAGLRSLMAGPGGAGLALAHGLQYDDVRDAWRYYLEHDNRGRGFVLIGHSQGSFILAELIRQEIDGKPVAARLVSAILLGTTLAVPRGKDVGGAFPHVPLCHAPAQTGCVITYASFRATSPPPANTLFGKVSDTTMEAACTNPAALGGGSGELHAYFSSAGRTIMSAAPAKSWGDSGQPIETPWVSFPGLLTARCASNENANYLEVSVHADPGARRPADIIGDLTPNWGLHLVDVNLAIGNLVDIVGQQAKAYLAGR